MYMYIYIDSFVDTVCKIYLFLCSMFSFRELQDKSEQLLRVKKEKAAVLSDLEAKLAARDQEVGWNSIVL